MNDFLAKYSDVLKNVSIGVLLIAILYLGMRGDWVYGKEYEGMKASYEKQLATALSERDKWMSVALEGLQTARSVSSARVPIMADVPGKQVSPNDVAEQLNVIKTLNEGERSEP